MRRVMVMVLISCAIATMGLTVEAAGPRPVAQPYGDVSVLGEPSYAVERETDSIPVDHLVMGADHILDQQCHNGGFGWPHADCSDTAHNITAPILLGVLGTHAFTFDPIQLLGAVNGGAFQLTSAFPNGEASFSSFSAVFLHHLALVADNTTFSTHASTELFDALVAGTYGPGDLDTAGWITAIEDARTGTYVNLRPWEFHTLIPAARALGQAGQDDLFEQAVLDGLDTLDNSDPDNVFSEILGLAGAVRGLAFARRHTFPAILAPLHPGIDGIDNLEDLTAYLASLQNPDGSWYWHSDLPTPVASDKDVQTSAFALLALLQADVMTAASHQPTTELARDWILSLQLPDGGFPQGPGLSENTEVEGEAVTAIAAFDATIFVGGFEAGNADLWDSVVR